MKQIVNYSEDAYHHARHPELLDSRELRWAWSAYAERYYFSELKRGDSVLEFGSGLGNNVLSISQKSNVVLVEPSPIARAVAEEEGLRCFPSLEAVPEMCFDWILCRHVLEHLDYPLAVLIELRNRLHKDGKVVLVLPCEPIDQPIPSVEMNYHLYGWNRVQARNLANRAGLVPVGVRFGYYAMRRKLLPCYRRFGGPTYARAVWIVGRLLNRRELVLRLQREDGA